MNRQEEIIEMVKNITDSNTLDYIYIIVRDVAEDLKVFGTPTRGGADNGK